MFRVGVESKFWTKIFFSKNFFYILFVFFRRELKSREFPVLWIFFVKNFACFLILWLTATFVFTDDDFLSFFRYSQTPKIIALFSLFFYRANFSDVDVHFIDWLYLCTFYTILLIFSIFTNAQNYCTFFVIFFRHFFRYFSDISQIFHSLPLYTIIILYNFMTDNILIKIHDIILNIFTRVLPWSFYHKFWHFFFRFCKMWMKP